jgi:hypothetical protein
MTTISCKFTPAPKPAPGRKVKPPPRLRRQADPARVARMLALAYHVEEQIEAGVIADYAAVAAALGVTRARISQVTALLLLGPEIQERILAGELAMSERDLRRVLAEPEWSRQAARYGVARAGEGIGPHFRAGPHLGTKGISSARILGRPPRVAHPFQIRY